MFDPAPSTWLGAGYVVDAANHLIKLNTNDAASNKLLKQLTDALADETTGDIRAVALALVEALFQSWVNTLSADRPTKMTIGRTAVNDVGDAVAYTYSLRFVVEPTSFTPTSE